MKSFSIAIGVVLSIVIVTLTLASLAGSDAREPDIFTTPSPDTSSTVPTATPSGSPTPVTSASPTTVPGVGIPASIKHYPPLTVEMSIDESIRYVLADGSSRNVKLLGTELVYSVDGVTIWTTATIEVSGPGLEPVVKEVASSFFREPVEIYDVRIWVAITKEFSDGLLRDDGATTEDARLVLSDARLPLTVASEFAWPYPGLIWHEGARTTYSQSLQGSPDDMFHHRDIDIGMPEGSPVVAWTDGLFSATDRSFDWAIELQGGAEYGMLNPMTVLHLSDVNTALEDTVIEKGELIGHSGQAAWFHTHTIYGYEFIYMLREWYLANATPETLSYAQDWLVAGPYDEENEADRLQVDYLGGEATSLPQLDGLAGGGQRWHYWDNLVPGVVHVPEAVSPFPYSGFEDVFGSRPESAIYMSTYVFSENERSAVLNIGASDAVDVWLGDERVLHQLRCIPGNISGDYGQEDTIHVDEFKIPVTLKSGWNRVLIRTAQRNNCPEAFQLSMRVSDNEGNAIEGIILDPLRGERKPEPTARPARPLPDFGDEATPTPAATSPAGTPTPTATPSQGSATAPSQSPPGGLNSSEVPMFVLFGSDDNSRAGGVEFLMDALEGRTNPVGSGSPRTFDGQPAHMSFYLIGSNIYGPEIDDVEMRDQYMAAYEAGHELGSHGYFVELLDGRRGNVANWTNDWLQPTQDALEQMFVEYGYSVEVARAAVKGFRAPGDAVDSALYDALEIMGYEYANSSYTNESNTQPAWWPGTLENGWPGGATWESRNFGANGDMWEIPQTYIQDTLNTCDNAWLDGANNSDAQEWVSALQSTFLELYTGNRAPLSICIHSQNFGPINTLANGGAAQVTPEIEARQEAFEEFLDWLLSGDFPEVRIVSHAELLEWMKDPVPLNGETTSLNAVEPQSAPTPVASPAPGDGPEENPGVPEHEWRYVMADLRKLKARAVTV